MRWRHEPSAARSAPLTGNEWKAVDDEAKQTLKMNLAARRLVDFSGPHGWQTSSINLGRVDKTDGELRAGVEARRRRVQTLIELRAPFELSRKELDIIARGGRDLDLRPVTEAARSIAIAENQAVFNGFDAGHITGILDATQESALHLTDDYVRYPEVVAEALGKLRNLGIAGPYGIALGPRCYIGLTETTTGGGYRVYDHVKRLLNGPVVWTPGIRWRHRGVDARRRFRADGGRGLFHRLSQPHRRYGPALSAGKPDVPGPDCGGSYPLAVSQKQGRTRAAGEEQIPESRETRFIGNSPPRHPFIQQAALVSPVRADVVRDPGRRSMMLYWALLFLVVAIVAGIFGFGGIAATASSIAQVLFFIFLVLFIISLFFGWRGGAFGP